MTEAPSATLRDALKTIAWDVCPSDLDLNRIETTVGLFFGNGIDLRRHDCDPQREATLKTIAEADEAIDGAAHATTTLCACGHTRSTHGDVIGQTECSRDSCACPGWRPTSRLCACGTSWDAEGPDLCPECGQSVAAIVRQAIHNSHDKTYRFPEDVEEHVATVSRLIAQEGERRHDATFCLGSSADPGTAHALRCPAYQVSDAQCSHHAAPHACHNGICAACAEGDLCHACGSAGRVLHAQVAAVREFAGNLKAAGTVSVDGSAREWGETIEACLDLASGPTP